MNYPEIEIITKYFPNLTDDQKEKFYRLGKLYAEWNEKINVISRKDIENVYEKHILHSLGIAKVLQFAPGTHVLDVGTGGGLPGIPLAILFPDTEFTLIDSIGKKITVVRGIAEELGLKNVKAYQKRAEEIPLKFDFVTGRGVTELTKFVSWIRNKIKTKQKNALPNGLLYLKGGDLQEEIDPFKRSAEVFPLHDFFKEEFFETKAVVYIELAG